jgi:hypothetical protein
MFGAAKPLENKSLKNTSKFACQAPALLKPFIPKEIKRYKHT